MKTPHELLNYQRKDVRSRETKLERIPVTVCIAATCADLTGHGRMVICAADRMLTSGDVEFEPEIPKIHNITTSICLMLAGNSPLQTEIILPVFSEVNARIKLDPKNWWNIADVADLYAHHYQRVKSKRAEKALLHPVGLTLESFLNKQQDLSADFVSRLTDELREFEIPSVGAIVCGTDPEGVQIYTANDGQVRCHNAAAFAAIGSGSGHANSQFMFAKHSWLKSFGDTLLLTFSAKKRAEAAPGVGRGTDMMLVGPNLGDHAKLGDHVIEKLLEVYDKTQEAIEVLDRSTQDGIRSYIEELTKPKPAVAQDANPTPIAASSIVPLPPDEQSPPSGETTEKKP